MSEGFSIEEEREKRLAAKSAAASGLSASDALIDAAISALGEALDSREMAIVMQRAIAVKAMEMMRDGRMAGGDVARLLAMVNDRADGKVADKVEVSMTVGDEAIESVRQLVRAGVLTEDAARGQLRLLGVDEVEVLE